MPERSLSADSLQRQESWVQTIPGVPTVTSLPGAFRGWHLISEDVHQRFQIPDHVRRQGVNNTFLWAVENAKVVLLDLTSSVRDKVSKSIRDVLKSLSISDPEMPRWLKSAVSSILDQFWDDLEREIESSLEAAMLIQSQSHQTKGPSGSCGYYSGYYWLRAMVLHHFLPHNRSWFGKLKDPIYLMFFAATMAPINGLRFVVFFPVLLFILFPWPANEFQLINFILLFKSSAFISSGFMMLVKGTIRYFWCFTVHKTDLLVCLDNHGPGSGDARGFVLDYLGNVVMVWLAFACLPFSSTITYEGVIEREYHDRAPSDHVKFQCLCWKLKVRTGRMLTLIRLDFFSFVLSLVLLAGVTFLSCPEHKHWSEYFDDSQFRENVYWCLVIYSFCSIPFAVFLIPGALTLLTHSVQTGFNKDGACVEYILPVEVDPEYKGACAGACAEACGPCRNICRGLMWQEDASVLRAPSRRSVADGNAAGPYGQISSAPLLGPDTRRRSVQE